MVDLEGFEPSTSSMPWRRAPNCATGPRSIVFLLTYHTPDEPIARSAQPVNGRCVTYG